MFFYCTVMRFASALRLPGSCGVFWGVAQSTVVGRQYDRVLLTSLQASRLSRSVPSTLCLRRSAAKFTRTERRLEGNHPSPYPSGDVPGTARARAGLERRRSSCWLGSAAAVWQCPGGAEHAHARQRKALREEGSAPSDACVEAASSTPPRRGLPPTQPRRHRTPCRSPRTT